MSFLFCGPAQAHRPHDDVQHLEFVSLQGGRTVGLAVIRNNLFRATDPSGPWQRVTQGLTNRFGFTSIMSDPSDPATLYLSAEGDGIFRSVDAGLTWEKANRGLGNLNAVLLTAGPTGRLLAADETGGLWGFAPSTGAWSLIATLDETATAAEFVTTGEALVGTEQGHLLRLNPMDGSIAQIWTAPQNTAITALACLQTGMSDPVIFLGTAGQGVYRATHSDEHLGFDLTTTGEENVTDIAVSASPDNRALVVVTTWTTVLVSTDSGRSFFQSEEGLHRSSQADTERYLSPHFRSASILQRDAPPPLLAIGGFSGLFLSKDTGATWSEANSLPADIIMAFAVSPPNEDGVHAIALGSYGAGVAISTDEGATWTIANTGLPDLRIRDVAFSTDFWRDGTVLSATKGTISHAQAPDFEWQDVSLRNKGLMSWALSLIRPPIERMMRANEWFSQLMNSYAPRPKTELTIHPGILVVTPTGQIYAGTAVNGLFRSEDIDGTFKRIKDAAPADISALSVLGSTNGTPQIYVGAAPFIEPPDPSVIPTFTQSAGDGTGWSDVPISLPIGGHIRADAAETASGTFIALGSDAGLILSPDGGASWTTPSTPDAVIAGGVSDVAISPDFASDGTILVSIKGQGLFRSTDKGATFEAIGNAPGQHGVYLSHFASFPATSSAIRFSPNYADNGVIFGSTGDAILKSSDRGKTWQPVSAPPLDAYHH